MSDTPRDDFDYSEAARMQLTPDDLHEAEGGLALDCPECGSIATVQQIVDEGRCSARLEAEETEVLSHDEEMPCTARLSLELVWASE